MTPHQLVNAVCVRLDSDELDPALVDLLAEALTRRHYRQLAVPVELSAAGLARWNPLMGAEGRPDDADA
jgi:hypothetical protein